MRLDRTNWPMRGLALLTLCVPLLLSGCVDAPTRSEAKVYDAKAEDVLDRLKYEVRGSESLLKVAKGVLVFPDVIEAAFWGGLQYGEGTLMVGGKSVDYYNLTAASFGVKFGAQKKDIVFVFMDEHALEEFEASEGWQVGLDGKVTLVSIGAEGSLNSETMNQPILAFVVGQRGLIAGFSLEGTKITRREAPPQRVENQPAKAPAKPRPKLPPRPTPRAQPPADSQAEPPPQPSQPVARPRPRTQPLPAPRDDGDY